MAKDDNTINEKEWLDLAWKYFQQHAQQRISYFNFFVIFSTIITTGFVATFQGNYKLSFLGIPLGLIQTFVSLIFLKIDLRNKFLTRNAEEIIKNLENDFDKTTDRRYSLFTNEEMKSTDIKKRKSFFLFKQWSHGQTYFAFYIVFGLLGIVMSVFSLIYKPHIGDSISDINTCKSNEIIINNAKKLYIDVDTAELIKKNN